MGEGGSEPIEEYQFLLNELDAWIVGIVQSSWSRGARRVQSEGEKALATYLLGQLSGIGANEQHVNAGIQSVLENHPDSGVPCPWGDDELMTLPAPIRSLLFPISVAANQTATAASSQSWRDL